MRFKAKLAPEQVSLLYSTVVPLSRLSASGGNAEPGAALAWLRHGSILCLDQNHVRISCKGKSQETDGISCFAELKAGGGIFLEHRIESQAEDNRIVMELDLGQLRVALQSVCSRERGSSTSNHYAADIIAGSLEHRYAILKLAKRNNIPCLCLEACNISSTGAAAVQVHYAIPVRILRPNEMQHHKPPQIGIPDVQLQMSPQKPLRTVLEKIRSMNTRTHAVYIQGNRRTGELTVSMESDGASIRTYFGKLTPIQSDQTSENEDANHNNNKDEYTVKVSAKKLCIALQWQQQAHIASSVLLCLTENELFVVHVTLNPAVVGFFTYYVPVHYLSNNPQDE